MKVLFAAQDPGGCDSLIPLFSQFESTLILCAGTARDMLKSKGISFTDAQDFSDSELQTIVEEFSADLIICSTSFADSVDKKIITLTNALRIPSICIVDYWANYTERFEQYPTLICAIDDLMKEEMVAQGIPQDRIRITGNPSFDNILFKQTSPSQNILFLSQPISQDLPTLPYTETSVLEDLISALVAHNISTLDIRLHPREDKSTFNELISTYSDRITIQIDERSLNESLASHQIIVGMHTMALFIAALNKKQVISYQPGVASSQDLSILSKLKLISTCTNKEELAAKLQEKPITLSDSVIHKYVNNSTSQIVTLARGLL